MTITVSTNIDGSITVRCGIESIVIPAAQGNVGTVLVVPPLGDPPATGTGRRYRPVTGAGGSGTTTFSLVKRGQKSSLPGPSVDPQLVRNLDELNAALDEAFESGSTDLLRLRWNTDEPISVGEVAKRMRHVQGMPGPRDIHLYIDDLDD